LDRQDFAAYDIAVLDLNWGSDYQTKCKEGTYRMLVHQGKFDPRKWEDVWTTTDSSRVVDGAVSLEHVVGNILLKQSPAAQMKIVMLHAPDVYNFEYMKASFQKKGLLMKIYNPTITPPPKNVSYKFLSRFEDVKGVHTRNSLIDTLSKEYIDLEHHPHFHGQDRYVAVFRDGRS
jgi:hypothetical protein